MSNNIVIKDGNGNFINIKSTDNGGIQTPTHNSELFLSGSKVSNTNFVPVYLTTGNNVIGLVKPSGTWFATLNSDANTVIGLVKQSGPWHGTDNVTEIGGAALALGQTTASASIPVVLSSNPDVRPASAPITTQDLVSSSAAGQNSVGIITGTPTAASFVSQAINGAAAARIQVTGVWTGTLAFEISADSGTTWVSSTMHGSGTSLTLSSITANGVFFGVVSGLTNIRVRATAAMTGTATVQMDFSAQTGVVQITNPLRIIDNTSGASASIKVASTAALATDTGLVVAIHPSSPLPTGNNIIGLVKPSGTWFTTSNSNANTVIGLVKQSGPWTISNALPTGNNVIGLVKPSGTWFHTNNASENVIGKTVGILINPSATFNRPGDTNAYTSADLVSNSTVAASVVALSWTAARVSAGNFIVRRVRLKKSSTSLTNASFRVHLYGADPTATSGISNGDNGAWLTKEASYLGAFDVTVDKAFSDAADGTGIPLLGTGIYVALASGQTLYGLIEARAAYTPGASETFTAILEIEQN